MGYRNYCQKIVKSAHNTTFVCSLTDTTNKMACGHEFESTVIIRDHFNFPKTHILFCAQSIPEQNTLTTSTLSKVSSLIKLGQELA